MSHFSTFFLELGTGLRTVAVVTDSAVFFSLGAGFSATVLVFGLVFVFVSGAGISFSSAGITPLLLASQFDDRYLQHPYRDEIIFLQFLNYFFQGFFPEITEFKHFCLSFGY